MVKNIFNLHKKFPGKKLIFKVIEKTKKISAEIFFKILIDLSRFFSKIMRHVFIWVFPDFLDRLYIVFRLDVIDFKLQDTIFVIIIIIVKIAT
jgi:hypothetical protein